MVLKLWKLRESHAIVNCSEGICRADMSLSVRQTQEHKTLSLPVLREALPKTLRMLRMLALLIEHPSFSSSVLHNIYWHLCLLVALDTRTGSVTQSQPSSCACSCKSSFSSLISLSPRCPLSMKRVTWCELFLTDPVVQNCLGLRTRHLGSPIEITLSQTSCEPT